MQRGHVLAQLLEVTPAPRVGAPPFFCEVVLGSTALSCNVPSERHLVLPFDGDPALVLQVTVVVGRGALS